MPLEAAHGPVLGPAEVRITRTPLGGTPDAAMEELVISNPRRRLQGVSVRGAQSHGAPEINLRLRNDDNRINAWTTGDAVKVEMRSITQAAWTVVLDGCIGPVRYDPGQGYPVADVTVRGWSFILDAVNLEVEKSYLNTPWTSIADDLVATIPGGGYARSITADALTPESVVFPAGMKLREALDVCRRALNGATDKWEHTLELVVGVKTYRLYKRDATVQRVVQARDLLQGTRLDKGDIAEVVNRAVVRGATVPSFVENRLGAARAGAQRPTATTHRLAQPFLARDTPLSNVSLYLDRSVVQDPPTINATIARNNAGRDVLRRGVAVGLLAFRTHASIKDEAASALDLDDTNTVTQTVTVGAGATVELFAVDLGASPPSVEGVVFNKSFQPNLKVLVDYSDDDAAYTNAFTGATGSVTHEAAGFAAQTHRYWRVRAQDTATGGTAVVRAFSLLAYRNTGADATNAMNVQDFDTSSATTTSSTGAQVKEVAKWDLGASPPIAAKFDLRHSESLASGLIVLVLQSSSDGSAWTDLASFASTTSIVTDSLFLEEVARRYLRVVVDDDRAAASGAVTTSLYEASLFVHLATPPTRPLASDALAAGDFTVSATDLVTHPGETEPHKYSQPNLAIVSDHYYWLVLALGSAGSSNSWWDFDYSCGLDLTGLSIYLGFEEGQGTVAYDASGNGLNGTFVAAGDTPANRPEWIRGSRGGGLYLGQGNADGSRLTFSDTSATNPTTSLSMAWSSRPASIGTKMGIFGKGDGNPGAYGWFIDTDGKQLFVFWSGGVRKASKSSTALTALAWVDIGVEYDGANVTFYLNGALDGVVAQTGAIDVEAGAPLLGRVFDTGAASSGWLGGVDEFYFFKNRAIGAAAFAYIAALSGTDRALFSTDSGTTYSAFPADLLFKTRFDFNEHTLVGTYEDAASQALYASLVPGGVLYGAISDPALQTQDAVDAVAKALVNRRKAPPRRPFLVLPFDPTIVSGKRLNLTLEAAQRIGLSTATEVDAVQVDHVPSEQSRTMVTCDEYPADAAAATDATITYATGATV